MLRISRLTDHAIVVLAHLARDVDGGLHSAHALSESLAIPQPTVAKVLKCLTRHGLLDSTRGAAGGYQLARDAAEITVVDVVEAVEGPLALTACALEGADACDEQHHCQVAPHWPPINDAVRAALSKVSMRDLARPTCATARTLQVAHGGR